MIFSRLRKKQTLDERSKKYHEEQWTTTKESTHAFLDFIRPFTSSCKVIVDLGSGGGAATFQVAGQNSHCRVIGVDSDYSLVRFSNSLANKNIPNLEFHHGNFLNLKRIRNVDMVMSIHTLMLFPECRKPLKEIALKLKPKWIAISSLFYDGEITVVSKVIQHLRREDYYTTFSIQEVERVALRFGYKIVKVENFEMPFDLARPDTNNYMQTYTIPVSHGDAVKRLQLSGPLLLDWKMILLEKI